MNELKLYHVQLTEQCKKLSYDSYSDFVVAAYSENQAREYHPGTDECIIGWSEKRADWISKEDITKLNVTLLGLASPNIKPGIICTSFHAG